MENIVFRGVGTFRVKTLNDIIVELGVDGGEVTFLLSEFVGHVFVKGEGKDKISGTHYFILTGKTIEFQSEDQFALSALSAAVKMIKLSLSKGK